MPREWYCTGTLALSKLYGDKNMKSESYELNMTTAISNEIMNYVALLFVNDGYFPTIANTNTENGQSVANRHQEALDCWSGGLRTIEGTLKPAKCFLVYNNMAVE